VSSSASSGSDPLAQLFRCLVENLAALDPGALAQPLRVADIHERLVPYRTHRASIGVDTGEDYEMTVLRLLAGERGLVEVYPVDVREALEREVAAANPETDLYRQFPDASVLLAPEHVALVLGTALPSPDGLEAVTDLPPMAPPMAAAESADQQGDRAADEDEPVPFMLEEGADAEAQPVAHPREMSAGTPCPYCGGALPVGRTVLFCPHCGQNIGVVHCPACGTELDVGWQWCIACGQKMTGLG
jgi:double zinc ribbon protein